VKTRKEKSGGVSVTYLTRPSLSSNVDLSLNGLVGLYQKAATGYESFNYIFLNDKPLFEMSFRLVDVAIMELDKRSRKGEAPHDAWNNASVFLIKAAQAHARYFVVDRYVSSILGGNFSAPVRQILTQLCELFVIYWLTERHGDFILVKHF